MDLEYTNYRAGVKQPSCEFIINHNRCIIVLDRFLPLVPYSESQSQQQVVKSPPRPSAFSTWHDVEVER